MPWWWLVAWFLPVPPLWVALVCLFVGIGLAGWIAGEAEKELGHDAHPIVIDEVVGQSVALLFAPHDMGVFAAALVLFRIFDVWKPLGANEAQKLPGGWGVVADDVIAGLASCLVLQVGLWAVSMWTV